MFLAILRVVKLHICLQSSNVSGESLKDDTSFWKSSNRDQGRYIVYHCSAGPEDLSQARKDPEYMEKSKRGKIRLGKSCKVGCQMKFTVTRIANTQPPVSKIVCPTFEHRDKQGRCCHKLDELFCPAHLSRQKRAWVTAMLDAGFSTRQILCDNEKMMQDAMARGEVVGRDFDLCAQDVRNCERHIASSLWKLHINEAQSLRMWAELHAEHVFIYQEEDKQAGQPFVLGFLTENMQANAHKFGNDGVVCMDATFGTNHFRMPLYTGLVVDGHYNGLPIFYVLTQSSTQETTAQWLQAFNERMQQTLPGNSAPTSAAGAAGGVARWRPSCFLVDDSQAEINALRCVG
jgi:hypothetical protein